MNRPQTHMSEHLRGNSRDLRGTSMPAGNNRTTGPRRSNRKRISFLDGTSQGSRSCSDWFASRIWEDDGGSTQPA
jgi:hypothetical protein